MARPKKEATETPVVDTRSAERKIIDRARSTLARITLPTKYALGALEPATELLDSPPSYLSDDDRRQLAAVAKDARRVMIYLPTVLAMTEYVATHGDIPNPSGLKLAE